MVISKDQQDFFKRELRGMKNLLKILKRQEAIIEQKKSCIDIMKKAANSQIQRLRKKLGM